MIFGDAPEGGEATSECGRAEQLQPELLLCFSLPKGAWERGLLTFLAAF